MLNFIIGKSGSGKTQKCYELLSASASKKPLLIVPEQFEFETEKSIYRLVGAENFNNIEISTFTKLSEKIISCFSSTKETADDVSKQLIMYKTLREVKPQLVFYSLLAEKPSFSDMMINAVAMMKSGGVSPKKLDELLGSDKEFSENLNLKLLDLLTIYKTYNCNLEKSFSDKLDSTAKAAELARENDFFRGRTIFFDGFSSFSGSQYLLIQPIIAQSDEMYLTVCKDPDKENKMLFGLSERVISKLSQIAEDSFVKTKLIKCRGMKRFGNDELAVLSDKLYQESFTKEQQTEYIKVINTPDYYSEAEYVCAEIRHLIMEKSYRFNDILIMTTDNDGYFSPLDSTFEKYEIPAFIDIPEIILHKPLVNLIMSILSVMESFSTEAILRLVKTGFIRLKIDDSTTKPLTFNQINALEMFVYKWGIRSEDWKNEFPDKSNLTAEEIRSKLIPPLAELKIKMKNATGAEITSALCSYLFDVLDIKSSVYAHCKEVGNENLNLDKRLSEEYRQLWSIIADIFEAIHKCLSDYKITISDYIKLLREVFRNTNISKPPQVIDSIMVGSIGRTRTAGAKALFVMGVNDGKFPLSDESKGFFTARETEEIEKHGLDIAPNRLDSFIMNRFMTYKAFSIPSERLYITYPMMNTGGEPLSKAAAVSDVKKLFTSLTELSGDRLDEEFYCVTRRSAQQHLARLYRHRSAKMRAEIMSALTEDKASADFLIKLEKILRKDLGKGYEHRLTSQNAKRIYREKRFSASRVDDISKCRFMFYCKYGLKLKEPEQMKLDKLNIGNIVHFALQGILSEYSGSIDAFINADVTTLNEKAHRYLAEYKNSNMLGDFSKTKRFDYLYENLSQMIVAVLKQLRREFSISKYRPKYFEINISDYKKDGEKTIKPFSIKVEDVGDIHITGKIDRVDCLETENSTYVRVIDYKTGKESFDIYKVYYGLKTQMLLYLYALCDSEQLEAGGVAYLPAHNDKPISGERDLSDKKLLGEAMKARKLSGIVLKTDEVSEDYKAVCDGFKSIAETKSAMPACELVSPKNYEIIKDYLTGSIGEKLSEVYNGSVDAVPLCEKDKAPCSYCDYSMICGNEAKNPSVIIDKEKINEILKEDEENGEVD